MITSRHRIYAVSFVLALAASSLHATAENKLPAPKPEFLNSEQLAEWRAKKTAEFETKKAQEVQRRSVQADVFYTGKPYLEDLGTYAFLYRSYDPELSRWTSTDPSGFPDGANNSAYMAVPTAEFDWQGLLVKATYSITKRRLTIIDGAKKVTWNELFSGNNEASDIGTPDVGPIPTGSYSIFSRKDFAIWHGGLPGYILDPQDSSQKNDRWDEGPASGRFAFRIHEGSGAPGTTEGCIVAPGEKMAQISSMLQSTQYDETVHTIDQTGLPDPTTFTELYLGSLEVLE